MPFVMRGDGHIALPVSLMTRIDMRLSFDVRIDDTLRDHVLFGDTLGDCQYRYTRGRKHLFEWREFSGRGSAQTLLVIGLWAALMVEWDEKAMRAATDAPLLFGAHSTNGGGSYLSPLRGSIRHIRIWVKNELQHWWPIHEGRGLVVHDIIGGAHGTIHKGLGAWRVETSPTAPPVESMTEGMMRSMV